MKANNLDELLQRARRAPADVVTQAPPFFAARVTANWLSVARRRSAGLWERFALRGAAISLATVIIIAGSSLLLSDNNPDEPENDDAAADIFTLP
jgi:hypothetical protein